LSSNNDTTVTAALIFWVNGSVAPGRVGAGFGNLFFGGGAVVGYIQIALMVIVVLIVGGAGYQALFGPGPRAERAVRVLRVVLAPAVLGALLGVPEGQEIVEWAAELVCSLIEAMHTGE
jgi:hypothetical protein